MDVRLNSVIERLSSRPSERPHLRNLARQLRIGVRTLESLFKAHTGQPFTTFCRALRISRAKSLLAETDEPVKVIAFTLGYTAVEVFCRDFKRLSGCTAVEYRLRSRQQSLQKKSIE
jgi:transcriptional regulator GlxA family with amidase domain